jgi:hypothetical protein
MDVKGKIKGIREYFVKNRMFSELRGFNAAVRMFDDKPKGYPLHYKQPKDMSYLDNVESYYKRVRNGQPLTPEECEYIYRHGRGKSVIKDPAGVIETDAFIHNKEYNDWLKMKGEDAKRTSGGAIGW